MRNRRPSHRGARRRRRDTIARRYPFERTHPSAAAAAAYRLPISLGLHKHRPCAHYARTLRRPRDDRLLRRPPPFVRAFSSRINCHLVRAAPGLWAGRPYSYRTTAARRRATEYARKTDGVLDATATTAARLMATLHYHRNTVLRDICCAREAIKILYCPRLGSALGRVVFSAPRPAAESASVLYA